MDAGRPVIRAAAYIWDPWVRPCFVYYPRNCSHPGVEVMLIYKILTALGFSVEFHLAEDNEEVQAGMIAGLYDISATPDVMDVARYMPAALTHTVPVIEEQPMFIVRNSYSGRFTDSMLFAVCEWQVWLVIFATLTAVLTATVLSKMLPKTHFVSPWYVSRKSSRLSKLVWSLGMSIVLGVYGNLLAIVLSNPPEVVLPFRNVEEFSERLAKSECRAVIDKAAASPEEPVYQMLNPDSTNDTRLPFNFATISNMRKAFKANPPFYVSGDEELVEAVLKHSCYVGLDFKTTRRIYDSKFCGLSFIESDELPKRSYVYTFRKDMKASRLLHTYFTTGDPEEFYMREVKDLAEKERRNCPTEYRFDPNMSALSFQQLADAFWLLLGMNILSLIAFIVEFIRGKNLLANRRAYLQNCCLKRSE